MVALVSQVVANGVAVRLLWYLKWLLGCCYMVAVISEVVVARWLLWYPMWMLECCCGNPDGCSKVAHMVKRVMLMDFCTLFVSIGN